MRAARFSSRIHHRSGSFMSPHPTAAVPEQEPGQLLKELERRQDEALEQLDHLDRRLKEVLAGLGVTLEEETEAELT